MKRLILIVGVFCMACCAYAQRYDYDDIYFNPKKDIKKSTDDREQITEERVESDDNSSLIISNSSLSYTDRINMFHRAEDSTQQRLAHIADSNYTTNIFVITDGQYVVDVDGSSVEITENYNYPYIDWNNAYWNNPYYYGPYASSYYWNRSMYGWYGSYYGGYGWSVGYYDPYFYGFYNPWYDPFYTPYWGYAGYYDPYCGHYHHHHHHGYYPHYGGGVHKPHHPKPDWGDYVARGNENDRRRVNSTTRAVTNVSTTNRSFSSTASAPMRRATSTSVSTSTSRGTSTSRSTATTSTQRRKTTTTTALPARPTNISTRGTVTNATSTMRQTSTSVRPSTTSTRSTSTVRSTSTTTRSTSTVRSTSSTTRSSGGFGGGSSSGGGRSGGSSSSSTRLR